MSSLKIIMIRVPFEASAPTTLPFVATADNLADFFTKPLKGKDFFRMRDIIMNVPAHARVAPRVEPRGGVERRPALP